MKCFIKTEAQNIIITTKRIYPAGYCLHEKVVIIQSVVLQLFDLSEQFLEYC